MENQERKLVTNGTNEHEEKRKEIERGCINAYTDQKL